MENHISELDLFNFDEVEFEMESVDDQQVETLLSQCDQLISDYSNAHEIPDISLSPVTLSELLIELQELRHESREIQVHMNHCNTWPYENSCKYGDDEHCPALQVYMTSDQLAQVLYSAEGGLQYTSGTWQDDLVREQFEKRAKYLMKLLFSSNRED